MSVVGLSSDDTGHSMSQSGRIRDKCRRTILIKSSSSQPLSRLPGEIVSSWWCWVWTVTVEKDRQTKTARGLVARGDVNFLHFHTRKISV